VRETGDCACEPAAGLLRRHVDEIDRELERLAALRAELASMLAAMTAAQCPDPVPGTWCRPDPGDEKGGDGHVLVLR